MFNPQVEFLTDEQIIDTYMYFEHGEKVPEGVDLKESFTKTMGRVTMSDENGTYFLDI